MAEADGEFGNVAFADDDVADGDGRLDDGARRLVVGDGGVAGRHPRQIGGEGLVALDQAVLFHPGGYCRRNLAQVYRRRAGDHPFQVAGDNGAAVAQGVVYRRGIRRQGTQGDSEGDETALGGRDIGDREAGLGNGADGLGVGEGGIAGRNTGQVDEEVFAALDADVVQRCDVDVRGGLAGEDRCGAGDGGKVGTAAAAPIGAAVTDRVGNFDILGRNSAQGQGEGSGAALNDGDIADR